jgi:hypothetical protein
MRYIKTFEKLFFKYNKGDYVSYSNRIGIINKKSSGSPFIKGFSPDNENFYEITEITGIDNGKFIVSKPFWASEKEIEKISKSAEPRIVRSRAIMKHLDGFENKIRKDFINYMLEFYGSNGIRSDVFDGKLTKDIIEKYVDDFIEKRKKLIVWSNGDSFDREFFRDVLLIKLDICYNTEYDVREYLTKKEIEELPIKKDTEKYNL